MSIIGASAEYACAVDSGVFSCRLFEGPGVAGTPRRAGAALAEFVAGFFGAGGTGSTVVGDAGVVRRCLRLGGDGAGVEFVAGGGGEAGLERGLRPGSCGTCGCAGVRRVSSSSGLAGGLGATGVALRLVSGGDGSSQESGVVSGGECGGSVVSTSAGIRVSSSLGVGRDGAGRLECDAGSGSDGVDGREDVSGAASCVAGGDGGCASLNGHELDRGVSGSFAAPKWRCGASSSEERGFDGSVSDGRVDSAGLGVDVLLGPNGGLSVGRGENYERNRRNREAKASKRKSRGALESSFVPEWRRGAAPLGEDVTVSAPSDVRVRAEEKARDTFLVRRAAENELATEVARRKLVQLQGRDEEDVIKMQRAQVLRTTETCKVQTEKAFASLLRSGNVPGGQVDGGGRVEGTVLTNSTPGLVRSAGDTISPDSSASMHEFRKCQKDLLDAEARNEKHVRTERRMAQVIERLKGLYPAEDPGVFDYSEPEQGITHYTLDSGGDLPAHAPDCFGYDNGKGQWRLSEPDYDGGNGFPY